MALGIRQQEHPGCDLGRYSHLPGGLCQLYSVSNELYKFIDKPGSWYRLSFCHEALS